MSSVPKISVIVPVYKVEAVLSKCVESVLSQSYTDFELLLIDDGSPDNSGSLCEEYAAKDSRIRVFHKKNGGVSSARNYGLKKAIGDYVVFVDSDDWVDKDFFLTISRSFDRFDMIFFGAEHQTLLGTTLELMVPQYKDSETSTLADLIYSLFSIGLLGYMWSFSVRRDIIIQNHVSFKEGLSIHEDSFFCYKCLEYAQTVVSLNFSPYRYVVYTHGRKTLSNIIPDNYDKIALERIHTMGKLQERVSMPEEQRQYIMGCLKYWAYSRCIDWAYQQQQPIKAIRKCFIQLRDIEDFGGDKSCRSRVFKWIIKSRSPYLMLFSKRVTELLGK